MCKSHTNCSLLPGNNCTQLSPYKIRHIKILQSSDMSDKKIQNCTQDVKIHIFKEICYHSVQNLHRPRFYVNIRRSRYIKTHLTSTLDYLILCMFTCITHTHKIFKNWEGFTQKVFENGLDNIRI